MRGLAGTTCCTISHTVNRVTTRGDKVVGDKQRERSRVMRQVLMMSRSVAMEIGNFMAIINTAIMR